MPIIIYLCPWQPKANTPTAIAFQQGVYTAAPRQSCFSKDLNPVRYTAMYGE